jgi:hypothetical protein
MGKNSPSGEVKKKKTCCVRTCDVLCHVVIAIARCADVSPPIRQVASGLYMVVRTYMPHILYA